MATSNSYNYSRNRDQIIQMAFKKLGVLAEGETLSAEQVNDASDDLNMMIKTFPVNGISLWRYEDLVVFPEVGKQSYLIGSTGDHASYSYVKTEIKTAASSGAGTIDVDSITGISNADNIGIVLSDGTLQWTTVNGTPSGNTITLSANLTAGASVDAHVYAYTTKAERLLKLVNGRIKINDGSEIPITQVSREKYFDLSVKSTQSTTNEYYYNPSLNNGTLYVYGTAASVNDTFHFSGQRQIQDFDASTDTADFPQEWYEAIIYGLAYRLSFDYGLSAQKKSEIKQMADDALISVLEFDNEDVPLKFVPTNDYE